MPKSEFPAPGHDHERCVDTSMARAQAVFDARGERLTALRKEVLQALAESHKALGAYDIIDRLHAKGRRVAPISVYRVLDTLLDAGLAHRIESRNAFVACHKTHDDKAGPTMFLVCDECGIVAELNDSAITRALKKAARDAGFSPGSAVLEMSGLCAHCTP